MSKATNIFNKILSLFVLGKSFYSYFFWGLKIKNNRWKQGFNIHSLLREHWFHNLWGMTILNFGKKFAFVAPQLRNNRLSLPVLEFQKVLNPLTVGIMIHLEAADSPRSSSWFLIDCKKFQLFLQKIFKIEHAEYCCGFNFKMFSKLHAFITIEKLKMP